MENGHAGMHAEAQMSYNNAGVLDFLPEKLSPFSKKAHIMSQCASL